MQLCLGWEVERPALHRASLVPSSLLRRAVAGGAWQQAARLAESPCPVLPFPEGCGEGCQVPAMPPRLAMSSTGAWCIQVEEGGGRAGSAACPGVLTLHQQVAVK